MVYRDGLLVVSYQFDSQRFIESLINVELLFPKLKFFEKRNFPDSLDKVTFLCLSRLSINALYGKATRPRTEKLCSHNWQSDPLGSSFKKGREKFPL